MAGLYGEINSRADFFAMLDAALATANAMLARTPTYAVALSAARQLAALKLWTANGRTPTDEERYRISIGIMAARELDDPTRDPKSPLSIWAEQLCSLNNYTDGWPSDEVAANPPEDEWDRTLDWRQKMLNASRA